jgi:transcription antitermination protein NusB
MGDRRQAREVALMILYQLDVGNMHPDVGLERFFASFGGEEPLDPPPPFAPAMGEERPVLSSTSREYAERLVRGVSANLEAIDAEIQRVSAHWRLDRMARVDRNLLRIGAYEIIHLVEEVPRKVAINEAVEIAKRFGTAESSAFVNGILDRIGK